MAKTSSKGRAKARVSGRERRALGTRQDRKALSAGQHRKALATGQDRKAPVTGQDRKAPVTGQDRKAPVTGQDRKAPVTGQDRKAGGVAGDRWLDDFLPYQLYRVTNKLNARLLTRLRAMRINPSQWRVLSVLKAYGAMSINDIVAATIIAQPTVSRVVVRLERAGKVSRRAAPHDSRVMQISLTPEGVAAFRQIVPAALRHQDIAFRGISRKSIAQLVDTLLTIERNIEAGK